MEDYYKILEVNQHASPETIEKVYKILVKKYHPDLQNDKNKIEAEDKIKKINEAYDVLSDPVKREEYDNTLVQNNISYEKYNEIINENIKLKNELNYIKNKLNYSQNNYYRNNVQENYNYSKQQYNNNFNNNYYTTNNYKKNKFEIKNIFKLILSILLTGLIIFICFNIPFIYNLFYFLFDSDISLLLIVILIIIIYISKK